MAIALRPFKYGAKNYAEGDEVNVDVDMAERLAKAKLIELAPDEIKVEAPVIPPADIPVETPDEIKVEAPKKKS